MNKILRRSLAVGVVVLGGMQLVPAERENPPVSKAFTAPAEVMSILQKACYDCHSNETKWPWYSYVAPMSWLVSDHVREGREEMNFSQWDQASAEMRAEVAEEVYEEVAEGEMAPWYYRLSHANARLTDAERETLQSWAGVSGSEGGGEGHEDDEDD